MRFIVERSCPTNHGSHGCGSQVGQAGKWIFTLVFAPRNCSIPHTSRVRNILPIAVVSKTRQDFELTASTRYVSKSSARQRQSWHNHQQTIEPSYWPISLETNQTTQTVGLSCGTRETFYPLTEACLTLLLKTRSTTAMRYSVHASGAILMGEDDARKHWYPDVGEGTMSYSWQASGTMHMDSRLAR